MTSVHNYALFISEGNGTVFIKTDQMDGETDWKLRRAIRFTQTHFDENMSISNLEGIIRFTNPHENIYEFEGAFEGVDQRNQEKVNEFLSLENTLWANTAVASGSVLAIVIYTGKETRMALNSRAPRSKTGKTDLELNFISKILFLFMLIVAAVLVVLDGFGHQFYVQFFRYVLLLASIIPISLRVNLDFAKTIFSVKIGRDPLIPGAVARNSNIPEELGRISYLLSDKTGTLTKNEMKFKKLVLEHIQFEEENMNTLLKTLQKQFEKASGPMKDVEDKYNDMLQKQDGAKNTRVIKLRRDKDCVVRDLMTALAVCHNVTPIVENGTKVFHASSPDEIALVRFAEDVKVKLIHRDANEIQIENSIGKTETYSILAIFPFTSESKRMGILVRHTETNRIIFFLKGADSAIQPRVKEVYRSLVMDECESLARTGLRTMVVAARYVPEPEYQEWKKIWDRAVMSLSERSSLIRKAGDLLEQDLDFLGITGVEDKLQDDINDTLESIRNAGIKVWMLTGDKVETAKCVAVACGLKATSHQIFEIKDNTDDLSLINQINEFSNKSNHILLIDGASLNRILEHHASLFFKYATQAPAVICCRCMPTQKALIAEMVKKCSGGRVAGIGDGGNDVGMIQAADVGIGIVGKEGKQASLASDFSINQFSHLKPLVLWHGRLYYKNSSKLSHFVIHRGLIISFIQALFISTFYYVAIPIYNGWLMLGYTTIYTMFPVFCLVISLLLFILLSINFLKIFDEDVSKKKALEFPILYKSLQKGRQLSTKSFLVWLWKSIFQVS